MQNDTNCRSVTDFEMTSSEYTSGNTNDPLAARWQ